MKTSNQDMPGDDHKHAPWRISRKVRDGDIGSAGSTVARLLLARPDRSLVFLMRVAVSLPRVRFVIRYPAEGHAVVLKVR